MDPNGLRHFIKAKVKSSIYTATHKHTQTDLLNVRHTGATTNMFSSIMAYYLLTKMVSHRSPVWQEYKQQFTTHSALETKPQPLTKAGFCCI